MAQHEVTLLVRAKDAASAVLNKIRGGFNAAFGAIGAATKFLSATALALMVRKLGAVAIAVERVELRTQRTFGADALERIRTYAKEQGRLAGLSQSQTEGLLSTAGTVARGFRATSQEAADFAETVFRTAADATAFYGGNVEDSQKRVLAAIGGSEDALREWGITLSKAEIEQVALTQSGKASAKQLTEQERAMAGLTVVQRRLATSQGALGQSQLSLDTLGRRFTASLGNMVDNIARGAIPAFRQVLLVLNEWGPAIEKGGTLIGRLIGTLGTLVVWVKRAAIEVSAFLLGIPARLKERLAEELVELADFIDRARGLLSRFGIEVGGDLTDRLRQQGNALAEDSRKALGFIADAREELLRELDESRKPLNPASGVEGDDFVPGPTPEEIAKAAAARKREIEKAGREIEAALVAAFGRPSPRINSAGLQGLALLPKLDDVEAVLAELGQVRPLLDVSDVGNDVAKSWSAARAQMIQTLAETSMAAQATAMQQQSTAAVVAGATTTMFENFGAAAFDSLTGAEEGAISFGAAFKGAMLGAVAQVARTKGQFYAAESIAALAQGIAGDPRGFAAAAKYGLAAAAMFTVAGFAGRAAAGGGGGAGGAARSGATSFGATVGEQSQRDAIIYIQGSLLDMSNPQQAEALARAIQTLSGRNVRLVEA